MKPTVTKHLLNTTIMLLLIAIPTVIGFLSANIHGFETNITIIYIL